MQQFPLWKERELYLQENQRGQLYIVTLSRLRFVWNVIEQKEIVYANENTGSKEYSSEKIGMTRCTANCFRNFPRVAAENKGRDTLHFLILNLSTLKISFPSTMAKEWQTWTRVNFTGQWKRAEQTDRSMNNVTQKLLSSRVYELLESEPVAQRSLLVSALLLLYDVTNKTSYDNIRAWLSEIREHANEDVVIMLLGEFRLFAFEESRWKNGEKGKSHGAFFVVPFPRKLSRWSISRLVFA